MPPTNPDSIFLGKTNLIPASEIEKVNTEAVVVALTRLNRSPRGSVHQRLQEYRRLTEELISNYAKLSDLNDALIRENDFLGGGEPGAQRRRWTDEEDLALVEMATKPEMNMVNLAVAFNRTPGAVASRLTYLVGVRRLSRHVAGHLIGYLDGEPVEGRINGEVVSD